MSTLIESLAVEYLREHPLHAARVLDQLDSEDAAGALTSVSAHCRAEVLRRMNSDSAARAIAQLQGKDFADTLVHVDPVRAARWLALLPEEESVRLLALLPEPIRMSVQEALSYPSGSAGFYMDAGTIPFQDVTTVDEALKVIREVRTRRVADVMVCDENDVLLGVISLQELLGAAPETLLGSIAHGEAPFVHAMTSDEEVVDLLNKHRLASLPVVDLDHHLLGVIRHDALVQAAQKTAGDDMGKMVGVGAEERALSGPGFTIKSRLPWLLINLLTAFAAASVVSLFDATIARFTALAVLLPVVAGQSGNTGAQALAVTSRGLALREIRTSHWLRVLKKEVLAAAANGVAVALVTGAGVWVWSNNLGLCGVIAISMVISMILAAISGAVVPIILSALGRDPATASSIILTTVTDIAGFFSFLGLATALSSYL